MKKFLIAILMAMPVIASAQDNTWERIEQEPVPSKPRCQISGRWRSTRD